MPKSSIQQGRCSHELTASPVTSQPSCQLAIAASASSILPCRHCHLRRPRGRARGLCRVCFANPRIRKRYPWLRRECGEPWEYRAESVPEPYVPTHARPQTEEKIVVMTSRRIAKKQLFHPGDAGASPRDPGEFLLDLAYALVKGVYRDVRIYRGVNGEPVKVVLWRAQPIHEGKRVHLGHFPTRADACLKVLSWQAAGHPPPEPVYKRKSTPSRSKGGT